MSDPRREVANLERMRAALDGGCLYLSGESSFRETDKKTGETKESPQATKFACWLEGLDRRRFRVEFRPAVHVWIQGSKPFSIYDETRGCDGRNFWIRRFDGSGMEVDRAEGAREKVDTFSLGLPWFPALLALANGKSLIEALAESRPEAEESGIVYRLYSVTLNEKIQVTVDPADGEIASIEAIGSDLQGNVVLSRRWEYGDYAETGGPLKFPRRITYHFDSKNSASDWAYAYDDVKIGAETRDGLFSPEIPPDRMVFDRRSRSWFEVPE